MGNLEINFLKDLNRYHSAPLINDKQRNILLNELSVYMKDSDWFTIGIMATSSDLAISNLRDIEFFFNWSEMKISNKNVPSGPVFLKANQRTGEAYIRLEHGLGEGILLSCQSNNPNINTFTFGPFPLYFFQFKG